MRVGVSRSAGTVTSAAFVMVSVFAIFASLHMVEMKELGLGLAAAVLLDAVVVRSVVLPSLLVLLGDRVRWPGRGGDMLGRRVVLSSPGARPTVQLEAAAAGSRTLEATR